MFVVIEGIDGSGKGTVTRELHKLLEQAGHKVESISFPAYEKTLCGKLVGRYLDGEFGEGSHPYLFGSLWALDRFERKPYLEAALQFNDVVVSDRYIPSQLCYSAMTVGVEERSEVVDHFVKLEYGLLELPVPDVIIFLDVPVKFAVQNIAKKAKRSYTDKSADKYEADVSYLNKVRSFYVSGLMNHHPPTSFQTVKCERNGHLISIEKVVEKVRTIVFEMLKG